MRHKPLKQFSLAIFICFLAHQVSAASYEELRQKNLNESVQQQQNYKNYLEQQNQQPVNPPTQQPNQAQQPPSNQAAPMQPPQPPLPPNVNIYQKRPAITPGQPVLVPNGQILQPVEPKIPDPKKSVPNTYLSYPNNQSKEGQWYNAPQENPYGATLQSNPSQNSFEYDQQQAIEKKNQDRRDLHNIYAPTPPPTQPVNPSYIYR